MDSSTILILTFILVVVIAIFAGVAAGDKLRAARTAYQNSLLALKGDPTNPDLRQQTLHLGRAYSQLTRNNKRVALFDEMALANDINAAAGGSTALVSPKATTATTPAIDRLQELTRLKERGASSAKTSSPQSARRSSANCRRAKRHEPDRSWLGHRHARGDDAGSRTGDPRPQGRACAAPGRRCRRRWMAA